MHRRVDLERANHACVVTVSEDALNEVSFAPEELERLRTKTFPVRRLFNEEKQVWKDSHLQEVKHDRCKGVGYLTPSLLERILEDTMMLRVYKNLGLEVEN